MAEPIPIYRIIMKPEFAGKLIGRKRPGSRHKYQVVAAVAALTVAVAAGSIWHLNRPLFFHKEKSTIAREEVKLSKPASIAVLPFNNLSGDPEQGYFSDGITNDLITALSKFRELLVIASNTIFTYKGKPANVENVGKELGVRYVLEGSVQKAGPKVRVNAQLI